MNCGISELSPDVLIIGAGPSGLTAATALARAVAGTVLVLERETVAGGAPRHSDHLGYGIRDLHRVLSGPDYAQRLVAGALAAGAKVQTSAMVTGWADDGAALVTSVQGRSRVKAKTVVLATGARERPRAARLIPGDRPPGVYTTGQLQNLVHLKHRSPGHRAVVVGAEPVSWSAVLTLREAGCQTVLMTTRYPSPESYAVFNLMGRIALRTPIATGTRLVEIIGHSRVEAVEVQDIATGNRRRIDCDTVVLTGDWIPDNELARLAGLQLDAATNGPAVDSALRTSRPGIFAVGNVLHPVDTADAAAADGRHVAGQVRQWLVDYQPPGIAIGLVAKKPFRWISPNLLRPGDVAPARHRLLLWTDELVRYPRVLVRQDGQTIAQRRLPWAASPGRVFRVPSSLLAAVNYNQGEVTVGLAR